MIEIPIEWILGTLIALGGVISTLATVVWKTLNERLKVQDERLKNNSLIIQRLQDEVDRLSKGCGMNTCLWNKGN